MKNLTLLLALLLLLDGCSGVPNNAPNKVPSKAVRTNAPLPQIAEKPNNGGIYQAANSLNLYADKANFKVGDIITVVLAEKTYASKNANTKLNKNAKNNVELDKLFSGKTNFERGQQGTATSGQSNSLSGAISASVTAVLDGGNLQIEGSKMLTLNNGDELVTIIGTIRISDIDPHNNISSNKIADAKISYTGQGAFADTNKTGWLQRVLFSPWFGL